MFNVFELEIQKQLGTFIFELIRSRCEISELQKTNTDLRLEIDTLKTELEIAKSREKYEACER